MSEIALHAEGLTKVFGSIMALDNIDLEITTGEIFGLLGPDGAGKTTLFRILVTLMLADSGTGQVCGYDIVRDYVHIRRVVGYMPGRFSLYPDLSVEENLQFYASLFGCKVSDNFDIVEPIYAQLAPFKKRRAANLSGGMKQKLALCCALIHKPRMLFLDEPTTGVDAVSRSEFWDMLGEIRTQGMPVMVSTPYMDEASRCDRIALINSGKILERGTVDEILKRNRVPMLAIKGRDNYRILTAVRKIAGVTDAFLSGEYIHLFVDASFEVKVLEQMRDIEVINRVMPDIEDVFIRIMSNGDR